MATKLTIAAIYPDSASFVDIFNDADLTRAEEAGAEIYTIDEKTSALQEMIFDGENWLTKRPKFVKDESMEIALPRADYVDAVNELFQAEIEAIADEMEPQAAVIAMGVKTRMSSLWDKLSAARKALESEDIETLQETTKQIRGMDSGAEIA